VRKFKINFARKYDILGFEKNVYFRSLGEVQLRSETRSFAVSASKRKLLSDMQHGQRMCAVPDSWYNLIQSLC